MVFHISTFVIALDLPKLELKSADSTNLTTQVDKISTLFVSLVAVFTCKTSPTPAAKRNLGYYKQITHRRTKNVYLHT